MFQYGWISIWQVYSIQRSQWENINVDGELDPHKVSMTKLQLEIRIKKSEPGNNAAVGFGPHDQIILNMELHENKNGFTF